MCVIFVLQQQDIPSHLPFNLIIASNRDEFLARPTEALNARRYGNRVLYSGIDTNAGGTWIGINDQGVSAFVTNCRELPIRPHHELSRGKLVTDALTFSDWNMLKVTQNEESYSGFNFVRVTPVGTIFQFTYYGTHDKMHPKGHRGDLVDSFSISNGTIHSKWTKMTLGLQLMREALSNTTESLFENLISVLINSDLDSSEQLPNNTAFSEDIERKLSGIFVKPFPVTHPNGSKGKFGSVSSTLILYGKDGYATIIEVDWRQWNEDFVDGDKEELLKYAEKVATSIKFKI